MDRLKIIHEKGHALAVNDTYRYCTPEVIFSIDATWTSKRLEEIPTMPCPVVVSFGEAHPRPVTKNLTYIEAVGRQKVALLSNNPLLLTNGLNSGHGALGYAYLRGARVIYLLGFDMKQGTQGRSHFHEGYDWYAPGNTKALYPAWASIMDDAARQLRDTGVKVWNCSNDSAITEFPYKSYSEVL